MIVKDGSIIEHTKRIKDLILRNRVFENTDTRIDIMEYQLGEFVKFMKVYRKAYGHLSEGYTHEAKLCLANLFIQAEMLCINEGWEFDEIRDMGYEHLLEKMKEVHEDGGRII